MTMLNSATKAAEKQARRKHTAAVECLVAPEIPQLERLNGFVGFVACNVCLGLFKRRADHIIMRVSDGAAQLVASHSCA